QGAGFVTRIVDASDDPLHRALFNYVLESVDDDASGPFVQPAAHIFAAGSGDRLVLLSVMMDLAGLSNTILLGRSLDSDMTEGAGPSIDPWGYPLLRVEPGDGSEPIWLDPSETYALFDYIPPAVHGSEALILGQANIDQGTQALIVPIPTQPSEQEQRVVQLKLAIDRNGDAIGLGTETYQGSSGILLRQILDQYTDPVDFEQALAQALATSFPGLELQKLTITHRDAPDKPLILDYKFITKGFARVEGKTLLIERPILPNRLEATFAALPERQTGLAVLEPIEMKATFQMAFPKGTTAQVSGEPTQLNSPFGNFESTLQTQGNQVTFTRLLSVKLQRVSPQQYPDFKAFARAVDQGEGLKITSRP
ncbi:MAG: hypothetical protein AAFS10_20725, partial [Myxococcota bacterium]